jgi:hypothetical protein
MTDDERRPFAVPPATGDFDGIDLAFLDPNQEDDRRTLILAEHPELHRAIEAGLTEYADGDLQIPPPQRRSHVVNATSWLNEVALAGGCRRYICADRRIY